MKDIDKNDVDISRLFNWGKEVIIKDEEGIEYRVFMRLLGDADLNRARTTAIRHSNQLRKELKNVDSDKYLELVPDVSEMSKDDLANLVVISNIPKITRKAMSETDVPLPKEPDSDAELEELEKYQQAVDEYPTLKSEKVQEVVTKETNKLQESTKKMTMEQLKEEYDKAIIKDTCEMEMVRKFQSAQIFYASFSDKNYRKPLFKSLEDFENLRPFVKDQFLQAYSDLELSMDELKKSQEVMP